MKQVLQLPVLDGQLPDGLAVDLGEPAEVLVFAAEPPEVAGVVFGAGPFGVGGCGDPVLSVGLLLELRDKASEVAVERRVRDVDGYGIPLGIVGAPANRHDSPLLRDTFEQCSAQLCHRWPELVTAHLDQQPCKPRRARRARPRRQPSASPQPCRGCPGQPYPLIFRQDYGNPLTLRFLLVGVTFMDTACHLDSSTLHPRATSR
jgi:hypothetical protein